MQGFRHLEPGLILRAAIMGSLLAGPALPTDAEEDAFHTRASLVSESEWIQPGVPQTLALSLQMDEHWHTYWRNPGDSGLPTEIAWTLPDGLRAGELQWPLPEIFSGEAGTSYGYQEEVWLLCELLPSKDLRPGESVELRARVDWLECKEACIPGSAELLLSLPVLEGKAPTNSAWKRGFRETRKSLPRPQGELRATARLEEDTFHLVIGGLPRGLRPLGFLAAEGGLLDHNAAPRIADTTEGFALVLPASPWSTETPEALPGLLLCGKKGLFGSRRVGYWIEAPLEPRKDKD